MILGASLYFQDHQYKDSLLVRCPGIKNFRWPWEFKAHAYEEFRSVKQKANGELDLGELSCYCRYIQQTNPQELDSLTFIELNDKDQNKYCKIWKDRLPKEKNHSTKM